MVVFEQVGIDAQRRRHLAVAGEPEISSGGMPAATHRLTYVCRSEWNTISGGVRRTAEPPRAGYRRPKHRPVERQVPQRRCPVEHKPRLRVGHSQGG